MTFPLIVYGLCSITSAACALLLWRAYSRSRMPLLVCAALCFALLTVNNILVIADIITPPDTSLLAYRQFASLSAVVILLYGFLWKVE